MWFIYQFAKILAKLNRLLALRRHTFTDPGLERLQKWLASKWFIM